MHSLWLQTIERGLIMKCARCNSQTVGKSKYCRTHRAEARKRWKSMISEKSAERNARYTAFSEALESGRLKAQMAAKAAVPVPMVVQEHENMLDDGSPIVKQWHHSEGVCGFAWVRVLPGNSSFARWAVKRKLATSHYRGGITLQAGYHGQSLERAEAYTRALAKSLRTDLASYNLRIYSQSRID